VGERIEDRNVTGIRGVPSPRRLKSELPADAAVQARVARVRAELRDLLHGRDRRLLAVVGPCSIHDPEAALRYAERLAAAAERVREQVLVVMRTYFEKPRTTVGWKGLINDPHLDGSCDVPAGLRLTRETLLGVNRMGVACGSELLDPISPQFVADLLAWGSIGARTAASQTHRELASGVSMPVGIKNGIDGSLEVARDAMIAAAHPHTFLGIDAEGAAVAVATAGNPDRHLVLRGGSQGPNYAARDVAAAGELTAALGIARGVLVDCSHANSGKDHRRQPAVCRAVLEQVRAGQPALLGVALESHLAAGRQDWSPGARLAFGVSITDACLGWDETSMLLEEIADASAARTSPA
jgi:3-deoxy-7-phosphoheptulonate synthase